MARAGADKSDTSGLSATAPACTGTAIAEEEEFFCVCVVKVGCADVFLCASVRRGKLRLVGRRDMTKKGRDASNAEGAGTERFSEGPGSRAGGEILRYGVKNHEH